MFPKTQRLNKKQVKNALTKGKRFFTKNFVLYYIAKNKTEKVMYSIIVPKKISVKAIKRNKNKRIVSNIIQQEKNVFGRMVFMLKNDITDTPISKTKEEIEKILDKINAEV